MIDVIIPAYNSEKFIGEALDSVIKQTLKPKSIIVVNDGSTDGTGAIIERYKQISSIPIVHIKKINTGLSAARNTGIKESTADFVALLDADDIWEPKKLEKQMAVYQQSAYKNLGLVYCNYDVIDEYSNQLKNTGIIQASLRGNVLENLLRKNIISSSGSGVLIKKSCFDTCGYFDEKLSSFEDWDMWIRIAKKYEVNYADEVLVSIRRHSNNMQNNRAVMLQNEITIYNKIINEYPALKIPRDWGKNLALSIVLSFPFLTTSIYKIEKGFSKKVKKSIFAPYTSVILFTLIFINEKVSIRVRKLLHICVK